MRFGSEQLRHHALAALEELTQECRYRSPSRTYAVRFLLAYLAAECADRQPFDDFWRALAAADMWRLGAADQALRAICRELGCERDDARMMATWTRLFERERCRADPPA